eukprot:m.373126 g.373126  ORF g.373126 m.373126 type:complete len:78 (+) comp66360_c0_seq1:85-318(+)
MTIVSCHNMSLDAMIFICASVMRFEEQSQFVGVRVLENLCVFCDTSTVRRTTIVVVRVYVCVCANPFLAHTLAYMLC